MPGLGELAIVLFIAGSTMVIPAIVLFLIVKAWGASQQRQNEQIRLLNDIAQNLERIGKRVEVLDTQAPRDERKDMVQ